MSSTIEVCMHGLGLEGASMMSIGTGVVQFAVAVVMAPAVAMGMVCSSRTSMCHEQC